ncbi:MAG: hypothetical protein M0Z87_10200 [Actinomycetota bacterium]|nr:hypothetical protein [Actinomycetota bacterium]
MGHDGLKVGARVTPVTPSYAVARADVSVEVEIVADHPRVVGCPTGAWLNFGARRYI